MGNPITGTEQKLKSITSAVLKKCSCKIKLDKTWSEYSFTESNYSKFLVVVNNVYEVDLRRDQLDKYKNITDLANYIDSRIDIN